ncbi:hypothetical protein SAMN02745134_02093 [Clostridium acidisoli DSM 12555]|uniref:Dolichyl-phosphate-mannose-protein mannosyltransferase n=1 Tax=Clostridium acidisoli DSM 12555 TaxID=1121291 RepID=A0A1W1XJJ0_9CLOT|nr:hypothetical protein [Clostridium acidisoli]SMC24139.1 hypothetical protein SAMN02745134_02093 [Clostridium acidisoli DSM 12555]
MEGKKDKIKYLIILIYLLGFIFFVFKMFFYAQYVARFPDEMQHISYIAYLEKEHTIIPNFEDMTTLKEIGSKATNSAANLNNKNTTTEYTFGNDFNYLGHPPLYYDIMRLSKAVQLKNNIITVNIFKLRCFNIVLSAIAMLLILYIGYTRIGRNPILNLLYVTIVISVPMLAYGSAGINNDTLALIGLPVFILGLLRFSEQKRNFSTYFIISFGVFIAFMAKLTAGAAVSISLLLYLILIIIKEKNAWFLISKKFIVTLPMYLITAAYYIVVYIQTGSILPTYRRLDPKDFYQSFFYVQVSNRTHMSFIQYAIYFAKNFLRTWTGIASNVSLLKTGSVFSLNNIAILILLFLPIILLFQTKKAKNNSSVLLVSISVYFGLAISAIIQWLRAYKEYVNISGYLGGYQSRYYLCGIAAIALAITVVMKNFYEKLSVTSEDKKVQSAGQYYEAKYNINYRRLILHFICLFFICLLLYEDFIYFLIHFKDYL